MAGEDLAAAWVRKPGRECYRRGATKRVLEIVDNTGFEAALSARVDEMLDACTRCGACFSACPIACPAGLGAAEPQAVVSGVLDILRLGEGPAESEKWA